jgi:kynurenine formamidase
MNRAQSTAPVVAERWIDLTHEFSAQTLYWPTAEPFRLKVEFHGATEQGFHYEANHYQASEHGGTHLDAPAHFAQGGKTVEQLGLDELSGPAVVIDLEAAVAGRVDHQISVEDLRRWEQAHGPIPSGSIVLLHTGFSAHWPDAAKYLGTAERGPAAVAHLHFPGLHPEAAQWLVTARRIKAVGLDTASIDHGQSTRFETHRVLAGHNIPVFENVARLDALPATGVYVMAAPMKIQGGSGAPLRIAARLH